MMPTRFHAVLLFNIAPLLPPTSIMTKKHALSSHIIHHQHPLAINDPSQPRRTRTTLFFPASATSPHRLTYKTTYLETPASPPKRPRHTAHDDFLDDNAEPILSGESLSEPPLDPDYVNYLAELDDESVTRKRMPSVSVFSVA
jgi:hypothetical protein